MQNIYLSYQTRRNGGILRGGEQWELLMEGWEVENAVCYILSVKEIPQAYMVYSIEGTVMRIHEMIYTGEEAKRECLDFIYGHRSHIVKAEWAAENGDTTFCYLNPGRSVCTLQPFLMARVVDVIQAWREFAVLTMKEPVTIRIEDELLEWNNDVFRLWETDGKKESQRLGEEAQWDYRMGIESFTQLLLGASSFEELLTRGAIVCGRELEAEPLKNLFPKWNNDIQEYY
nr:sterol carrier protein domain-containing protein [Lactonifactor longoviformis]